MISEAIKDFHADSATCATGIIRIEDTAYAQTYNWIDRASPSSSKRKLIKREKGTSSDSILENRGLLSQLDELLLLERNWDCEGAIPIDPQMIGDAKRFVFQISRPLDQIPKVVPMTEGRLQLEWHEGDRTLELEFESPGLVHYLKWDSCEDLEEEYFIPSSNFSKLMDLVTWFELGIENV